MRRDGGIILCAVWFAVAGCAAADTDDGVLDPSAPDVCAEPGACPDEPDACRSDCQALSGGAVVECPFGCESGTCLPPDQARAGCSLEASTCKQLLDAGLSIGDGPYTLYRDGEPYVAYCDMTTDGGGWTLCAQTHPTIPANWATTVWSDSAGSSFGHGCSAIAAAGESGAIDYRLTTQQVASDALFAQVAAGDIGGVIALQVGTATDPLRAFYETAFCGGDVGCGQRLNADGRIEKFRSHSCGGPNCANNDRLFYGTTGQNITDFFGQRTTAYDGVWHYLYQHGACFYDASRACYGSLTEDADSGFELRGLSVYHWIR